jgi:hypothetical protein
MDDFIKKSGAPNMYGAQVMIKCDRPESVCYSMTPTIVLKNNQPSIVHPAELLFQQVCRIINIVDYNSLSAEDAVNKQPLNSFTINGSPMLFMLKRF